MTVLDVKDIRVSDVTTDVISFIKQSSDLIDNYYPGRVVRLVVCNAPTWFWSVWTMISRVLPESVRKKIVILNDVAGLEPIISASQRPVAYGGTSSDLGTSPEHLEFISIGERWKSNAIVQASEPVVQRKEKGKYL
jgi:threonine dehydrogenase-like Zn-dependent dehydrogenase